MLRTLRSLTPLALSSLVAIALQASCAPDAAGPTSAEPPAFAKGGNGNGGGGGGGGGTGDPTVDAVDPDSASQDTTLDVLVIGSGFDDGSQAVWAVNGVPTPDITTNQTRFVNSKRIVANITIAAAADTVLYDVVVTTTKGRKGIGIELFRVKEKLEPFPVEASLRDDPSDGLHSDASLGLGGVYAAEVDELGNLFLDARAANPRKICFDFKGQPGAPSEDDPLGVDFCDDGWITTFDVSDSGGLQKMFVNDELSVKVGVNWVKSGYNWALSFGRDCLTNDLIDTNLDRVTHPDQDTWILEGSAATLCRDALKGKPGLEKVGHFQMPHQIVLTRVPVP